MKKMMLAVAVVMVMAVFSPVLAENTIITVKKGDNLWSLAEKHLGDAKRFLEIVKENRIANPDKIFPGQKLIIGEANAPMVKPATFSTPQVVVDLGKFTEVVEQAKKEILFQQEELAKKIKILSSQIQVQVQNQVQTIIPDTPRNLVTSVLDNAKIASEAKITIDSKPEKTKAPSADGKTVAGIIGKVLIFLVVVFFVIFFLLSLVKRKRRQNFDDIKETDKDTREQKLEYSKMILKGKNKALETIVSTRQIFLEFEKKSLKYSAIFYPRKTEEGKFESLFIPEGQESAVCYNEFADLEKSVKKTLKEYVEADFVGRLEEKFEAVRKAEKEGILLWSPSLDIDLAIPLDEPAEVEKSEGEESQLFV